MSNSVDLNTTDLTSFCLGHALPKLAIQTRMKTWQQVEVKGQLNLSFQSCQWLAWYTYYHTIGLINDMVVNTMATLEGQAMQMK